MRGVSAFLCGLLFGTGLLLSGMADPAKVQGFLDVAGLWDPSLALVMLGAIAAAVVPMRLARGRRQAWCGGAMQLPDRQRPLDRALLGGSLLFGIGWGIAGICPGPALTLLLSGQLPILVFILAMLGGMRVAMALNAR